MGEVAASCKRGALCYSVYLSTTSDEDLSLVKSDAFSFEKVSKSDETDDLGDMDNSEEAQLLRLLSHRNCWYLMGKHGGCSCHFRHDGSLDLPEGYRGQIPSFGPPEDWAPEDEEDIDSTRAVYDWLISMLSEGHSIDLVDWWSSSNLNEIQTFDVKLRDVPSDHFRFFGNGIFKLS